MCMCSACVAAEVAASSPFGEKVASTSHGAIGFTIKKLKAGSSWALLAGSIDLVHLVAAVVVLDVPTDGGGRNVGRRGLGAPPRAVVGALGRPPLLPLPPAAPAATLGRLRPP